MSGIDLMNKVAVVTGGASDIGKAISLKFSDQGATVHILELNTDNARGTVEEIEKAGGKAVMHQCNVAIQSEVLDVIGSIASQTPINILVNNAEISHIGNIETTTEEDMDKLYQVNKKGVYNCIKESIKK